jgi:hypothetical protein
MGTRPDSGGYAGDAMDPGVFDGAALVVAAVAGLVWALSSGSSESPRDEPAPTQSFDTPEPSM